MSIGQMAFFGPNDANVVTIFHISYRPSVALIATPVCNVFMLTARTGISAQFPSARRQPVPEQFFRAVRLSWNRFSVAGPRDPALLRNS